MSSFVPKQQTLALEVIMEKFFSPINLGSPKERREKARVFKNAIQEGFDAIDDANELRSGNEEIRRMGKRQKLADYWYEIVEHYEELLRGNTAWEIAVAGTMQLYSEELAGKTQFQNYKKILIWMKEKKAGKAMQNPGRFPVYGRDIDQATFAAVMSRNTKGLSMDPFEALNAERLRRCRN